MFSEAMIDHAAVRAWHAAAPDGDAPTGIDILKETKNSAVYRLEGIGVVAKRSPRQTASVERSIYRDVLPALGLPSLHYYGFLEAEPSFAWLFLEDSGGEECSLENATDRALASEWLANVHLRAEKIPLANDLPGRDCDFYLAELQTGRQTILDSLGNPVLSADNRSELNTLLKQSDSLESRWRHVEELCAQTPQTLVQGDFHTKNVHIRRKDQAVFALDWEYSGWGPAARDLPDIDPAAYAAVAGKPLVEIERLAALGRLFQGICAINWASERLAYSSALKGMRHLRCYIADLEQAMRALQWSAA